VIAAEPKPAAVRFYFMHVAGQRKIDDIRSASHTDPWSIRGILETSPKNQRSGPSPLVYCSFHWPCRAIS
jgi:hypothetical protein